ncbi:MAG: thiamine pyrophosphate-dependent enzyme [Acidobacteriaceae bacterium]|nr:thiamine pyrophosphate-dependent enzyme [Acidobacteriaceae bacterium]
MAENPLLPHRKLQELFTILSRARVLEKKQRTPFGREAVLAATTIHLEAGDYLSSPLSDKPAELLGPARKSPASYADEATRLPLAAATARGLQLTGDRIALAYTTAGEKAQGWEDALTIAQTERLPFVLCVVDATAGRGKAASKALTWPALETLCRKLQMPILTVDGDDAVAMYRAMQEATLRGRTTLGPCVIWAVVTPAATKLTPSQTPLGRLKRYLAARNISRPQ